MHLPSPSSHDRVVICPPSPVLPQVKDLGDVWTIRGSSLHKFLADVPVIGAAAALEKVPAQWREDAEAIDLSRLPACDPDAFAAEVWIAVHVETGRAREIGRGLTREAAYALAQPGEMLGALDTVGLGREVVLVLDYKTGWKVQAPAVQHRQLRAYAWMAAKLYRRTRAAVAICRIGEDGTPWFDRAEFDAFELATIEAEIHAMLAAVEAQRAKVAAGQMPDLTVGDHCRYCPAYLACPAQMALVRQFAAAPDALEQMIATATPDQLAAAWERVHAVEKVVARAKAVLQRVASTTPIPMGDGTVIGAVAVEHLDPDQTELALIALYGKDFASKVVTYEKSATKAALKDALKTVLQPGQKITHLERAVLEQLREAGAVSVGQQIRKHRPKVEEAPALPADASEVA